MKLDHFQIYTFIRYFSKMKNVWEFRDYESTIFNIKHWIWNPHETDGKYNRESFRRLIEAGVFHSRALFSFLIFKSIWAISLIHIESFSFSLTFFFQRRQFKSVLSCRTEVSFTNNGDVTCLGIFPIFRRFAPVSRGKISRRTNAIT